MEEMRVMRLKDQMGLIDRMIFISTRVGRRRVGHFVARGARERTKDTNGVE